MKFDWTLNAGHILTAGAMVASVALAWGNLRQDTALMDQRLGVLERTVERMADQTTRISVLERVVNDLPDKMDDVVSAIRQLQSDVAQ